MSIAHDISKGMRVLRAAAGSPVCTWNGAEVPCLISTLRRGTAIIIGGVDVDISLTFYIEKSAIATRPREGKETIAYCGRTFRIVSVSEPMGASHYEIDVADPNR